MRRTPIFCIFISVALLITACSSKDLNQGTDTVIGKKISAPGGTYTNISVSDLQIMLEEKDFIFINTHIPFEGDIPGTDLSIPFDEIEDNLDKLPVDQDAKIVLYCRSDRMSSIASETLVGLGYTNVWNLEGGMVAWEKAGLTLEGK